STASTAPQISSSPVNAPKPPPADVPPPTVPPPKPPVKEEPKPQPMPPPVRTGPEWISAIGEVTYQSRVPALVTPNRDGFCFLSAVGGLFEGGGEVVHMTQHRDHNWYLQGQNIQGIGARAIGVKTARRSWYKIEVKDYAWASANKKRVRMLAAKNGFCALS